MLSAARIMRCIWPQMAQLPASACTAVRAAWNLVACHLPTSEASYCQGFWTQHLRGASGHHYRLHRTVWCKSSVFHELGTAAD